MRRVKCLYVSVLYLLVFMVFTTTPVLAEGTSWDHLNIIDTLNQLELDESNMEKNPVNVQIFNDINTDEAIEIIDGNLFLYDFEILDVTDYIEQSQDPENPAWVSRRSYALGDQTLHAINVKVNRYTGGRDPGTSLFYLVSQIENGSTGDRNVEKLGLGESFRIKNIYFDEQENIWIDGMNVLWRSEGVLEAYTLLPSGKLITWSEVCKKARDIKEDGFLYTKLIKGGGGFYLWTYHNSNEDWVWDDGIVLVNGVVFRTSIEDEVERVEELVKTKNKASVYGRSKTNYSISSFLDDVLITDQNQIYYKTEYDGYFHLNQNQFIEYDMDVNTSAVVIGREKGIYTSTPYVLEKETHTLNLYILNGQYALLAEDLRRFGFGMYYDSERRVTLLKSGLNENTFYAEDQLKGETPSAVIAKTGPTLESDVRIFVDTKEIESHNVGGYSLIYVKDFLSDDLMNVDNYSIRDKISGVKVGLHGSITGQISLNTMADEDIRGQIVLYGSQDSQVFGAVTESGNIPGRRIGDLSVIYEQAFIIKAGSQNTSYSIPEDKVQDFKTYDVSFIGYKIDDLENTPNLLRDTSINKGSLKLLSHFTDGNIDVNLGIPNKAYVKGTFNLEDKVYYVDFERLRSVEIHVLKRLEPNLQASYLQDEMLVKFQVKQSDMLIPFELELDQNGIYEIRYIFNLYDENDNRKIYDEGLVFVEGNKVNTSNWINVEQALSYEDARPVLTLDPIIISIDPNYDLAFGQKSDIKVLLDGKEVDAINMEDYMMVPVDALSLLGLELEIVDSLKMIELRSTLTSVDLEPTVKLKYPENYSTLEVGDHIFTSAYLSGWMLKHNMDEVPLFNIQNNLCFNVDSLSNFGFDVDFNNVTRVLSVWKK